VRCADVILPLALPRPLTYRLPENALCAVGMRVAVQLGAGKVYTGIVARIHQHPPDSGTLKEVLELVDEEPVVTPQQIAMWEWMAGYYMCGLGEVMNAALPAGLRLAAESWVEHGDVVPEATDARQRMVLDAVLNNGRMRLADLQSILPVSSARKILRTMIANGWIRIQETVEDTYKPKERNMIGLAADYRNEEVLEALVNELEASRRNQKQVEALLVFHQLAQGNLERVIPEKDITDKVSESAIQTLVRKGVLERLKEVVSRFGVHQALIEPRELSPAQEAAYQQIRQGFGQQLPVLLHGVTSSGKTEIYVKLIQEVLDNGGQVLYLLPEIALTTQLIERLRKYFGDLVGVYHSRFNANERTEVWNAVLNDTPDRHRVILGARSALFLPYRTLQLVIVDEEHESSFKQYDPAPRYHARDAAIWMASRWKAAILLGSATPSVETYWNAQTGKYGYVQLNERFGGMELPRVEVVDLREQRKWKSLKGPFSQPLISAMEETISGGRQVILFQNRRGFSPFLQCEDCGHVPGCHQCDVSLTYHKQGHILRCHYCGISEAPGTECKACGSARVRMVGYGTERIEEELELLLPGVTTARLDLDTTRKKKAYQQILGEFADGKVQVLVGTQMVTKGLDFEKVGLVGIIGADAMLNFQDFRAHERAFQLMAQVAGRAGRSGMRGSVIIQAYKPDHWILQRVMQHDTTGVIAQELLIRKNYRYPPFVRMVRVVLRHKQAELVKETARHLAARLTALDAGEVLGPNHPPVARVMDQYHQQIILKLPADHTLAPRKQVLRSAISELQYNTQYRKVRVHVDVDPY
jgi:primosomal protein N' (replication factor Y)